VVPSQFPSSLPTTAMATHLESSKRTASPPSAPGEQVRFGSGTLHVLTLTPFFPSTEEPTKGCFIAEPLRHLKQYGVVSTVIAVQSLYTSRNRPNPSEPARWVRYPQLPGNFGLSSAGGLLYARLVRSVRRLHREQPFDVIPAHSALPCGHAGALLARELRIPYVVTVHGLDVFNACFQSGTAAEWRRRASSAVYREAQAVICISDKVRRILTAGQEEVRSAVVYNGVDPELFSPTSQASPQSTDILVVGNLLLGKGHGLVLRAMARIRSAFPGLRCSIIGEGRDRGKFVALAKSLGIEQQVRFLGSKGRLEVAAAMRSCTVFALPARFEALGCVYLEAMSCGKPAIACRGQGIEEIIQHGRNGWLVSDNVDELVEALSILLPSLERRTQIGAAARQTILDGLTLSHQAQQLAEIYRGRVE